MIYHQTEDYGDRPRASKETVSLTFILTTSIPEVYTHSSLVSCCTDGGVMLPSHGTKWGMRTTMNGWVTSTTNLIQDFRLRQKSGSVQVDLPSQYLINSIEFYYFKIDHRWRSFIVACSLWNHCIKVLGSDVAISVEVGFLENFIHFFITQMLSKLIRHILELLSIDFSLNQIDITLLSKSKDLKTASISSRLWTYPNLPVASFKKASKVSPPTCSVSRSLRTLKTNLLDVANPRLTNAFLS